METGVTARQIILNLLGLGVVLGGIYFVFRYFGITEVQTTIEHAGLWAPIILILAKASTIVIAPLSGAPLYPLAGALFGFWEGTLFLVLGDALGGAISFYISRIFGRHIVEKLMGAEEKFLSRALRLMGTVKGFLIARICFISLPEVISYGAGLTRISFFAFITIYTVIGAIPAMILAALGSVLTLEVWWVLPVAFLAGVVVIPLGFVLFRSVLNEWEKA